MRESIGGAWLTYMVIIFILTFIFFIAFIMNYASAYRAVNYVVTQIESCQGYGDCSSNWSMDDLNGKYHYDGPVDITCRKVNATSVAYDVTLYVEFDLPLIGRFQALPVKSETKSMHNSSC